MRLAKLDQDEWKLRSAEEANAQNPATFWISELERRRNGPSWTRCSRVTAGRVG